MHQAGSLPKSVRITDITGRDGFQNLKAWIPTDVKKEVLSKLASSGVRSMEITSFVSPKAIPQLADAGEIASFMREKHPEVNAICLVPNRKGAERAAECGIKSIAYVISVSEAHNKANVNHGHDESLADLAGIAAAFPDLRITLSVSTVFGCPFTGAVPIEKVVWLVKEGLARGASLVTLCDTIGVANPLQIRAALGKIREMFPATDMGVHLHDTHGMGLANTMAALEAGIDRFETSGGGLGGCPFAPGAAGNTATEDSLNMFHRMGINTGVDLSRYLDGVAFMRESIAMPLSGHLSSARTYAEFCFYPPSA
ncbi:hydroxymethylglutaryl-CoA lyase [Deltaproteobacteria bacterium]|nr:hydroxymethylglutaryl-CoA lyase [Deltaproteobacteria bacterium]